MNVVKLETEEMRKKKELIREVIDHSNSFIIMFNDDIRYGKYIHVHMSDVEKIALCEIVKNKILNDVGDYE